MRDCNNNIIDLGDLVAFAGPFGNQLCVGEVTAIKPRNDAYSQYARMRGQYNMDNWLTVKLYRTCINSGKSVRRVGEEEKVMILKKKVSNDVEAMVG